MGPSAVTCRQARPRKCRGVGPRIALALQTAVELRLGEKRACQLEDFVGLAQFSVLAFEFIESIFVRRGRALARDAVNLVFAHSFVQCVRNTADLRREQLHCRPQLRIFLSVLLHHAHGPLSDLWGKFG